jgi:hypothetical protein
MINGKGAVYYEKTFNAQYFLFCSAGSIAHLICLHRQDG